MTIQDIKDFFTRNPHLKIGHIEKEAGLSRGYISKLLKEEYGLTAKTASKLKPVMEEYGK